MNLIACSDLSPSRIPLTIALLSITALAFSAKAQVGFIHSTGGPVVTAANSNSTWHAQRRQLYGAELQRHLLPVLSRHQQRAAEHYRRMDSERFRLQWP